jgi:hypothetical protein
MPSFCPSPPRAATARAFSIAALLVYAAGISTARAAKPVVGFVPMLQEAVSSQDGPYTQPPAPIVREPPEPQPGQPAATPDANPQPPFSHYDPELFQRRIPKDQLAFLEQYAGAPSNELYRDKQFHKLMRSFVPDCTFHYGSDKSLNTALDEVIQGSAEPVQIREGRYVMLSGHMGPFLAGKGFLWIDMQEGIGLGGFYFHPTNGEPTPSVNIFSRQVMKEMLLDWSELPPAFAEDLTAWEDADRIAPLTTRYFITGSNKKILLEHDEDYCAPAAGPGYNNCDQMNEDASDLDVDAASYLEQTHHVTNATAWMIHSSDQIAWVQVRDSTCGRVLDPLGCHIQMTRERTRVILHAPPPPRPHPVGRR